MSIKIDDLLIYFLVGSYFILALRLVYVLCCHEKISFIAFDFKSAGGGKMSVVFVIAAVIIGLYSLSVIPPSCNPYQGPQPLKHKCLWQTHPSLVLSYLFNSSDKDYTPKGPALLIALHDSLVEGNAYTKWNEVEEILPDINKAIVGNQFSNYVDILNNHNTDEEIHAHFMEIAGYTFNRATASTYTNSLLLSKAYYYQESSFLLETLAILSVVIFLLLTLATFLSLIGIAWCRQCWRKAKKQSSEELDASEDTPFQLRAGYRSTLGLRWFIAALTLSAQYLIAMLASQACINQHIKIIFEAYVVSLIS